MRDGRGSRCSRLARGTHDQRDAHGRIVPRRRNLDTLVWAGCGVVARLCLTLPPTDPRLRVLILISPFKFLRQPRETHAGQLSIGRGRELCPARAKRTIHRQPSGTGASQGFAGPKKGPSVPSHALPLIDFGAAAT